MTSDRPDMVSDVFLFNERVIGIPAKPEINALTLEQFKWTLKAAREEIDEFEDAREALLDSNVAFEDVITSMVDACLDEVYYQFGTLKKMGITVEQVYACFAAIQAANMTKDRGRTKRGSDEDAVKPADFVDPKVTIRRIIFGEPK